MEHNYLKYRGAIDAVSFFNWKTMHVAEQGDYRNLKRELVKRILEAGDYPNFKVDRDSPYIAVWEDFFHNYRLIKVASPSPQYDLFALESEEFQIVFLAHFIKTNISFDEPHHRYEATVGSILRYNLTPGEEMLLLIGL